MYQRLKGPCKKAPLSNIMHICFGQGFPIHLLLVFSSVRRTNSFTNIKGGLISESLSLWLQSPKNVPNHYPELYLAAKEKILRVKEEQSGGTVDPVGHLIMLCVPLILCKM